MYYVYMDIDTSWVGKDLQCADLRHADLTNKVLMGTNLSGARLYGAAVSLTCGTFDGVILSPTQVAMLLMLIARADTSASLTAGIYELVANEIGEDDYKVLRRYMDVV